MTSRLRCAVIGVGYLGRFHAQKYAQLAQQGLVEWLGVVDANPTQAEQVARECGCSAWTDWRAFLATHHGQLDAVSVVVPTTAHYEVALAMLQAGVHVLVEKPMTITLTQADTLIAEALRQQRILAVGHLERFNPVALSIEPWLGTPKFIESTRIAPFKPRATDVSVLLDLMIHDVDLILSLVQSDLADVDCTGARVLTDDIDIAYARLRFVNGCVANVTASRVSQKSERKMRIFQSKACLALDFQNRALSLFQSASPVGNQPPSVERTDLPVHEGDALLAEITDFVHAIQHQHAPKVTGHDGRRALQVIEQLHQALTDIS